MIKMRIEAAHQAGWQIFEVVVGIPFLAGVALQWLVPVPIPLPGPALVYALAGGALVFASITLVVLARREFRLHGQPTDPGFPTHKIITTGVFSISRNPLYLGGIGLLLGLALAFRLPWAIVLLLPASLACQFILIAPEERYLSEKFGDAYRAYAEQVARWIGRKR